MPIPPPVPGARTCAACAFNRQPGTAHGRVLIHARCLGFRLGSALGTLARRGLRARCLAWQVGQRLPNPQIRCPHAHGRGILR